MLDGNNWRYVDTESLWTGRVIHRETAMFLDDSETLIRSMSGDMDENGLPHGPWNVVDLVGDKTIHWYWHGETVSEAQFEWRSK